MSTQPEKINAFFQRLTRERLQNGESFVAVLEVCGFNDWLIRMVYDYRCTKVILIQPDERKRQKTDRCDAAALSELLWGNRRCLLDGKPVRGLRQIDVASSTDQENRRLITLRRDAGVTEYVGHASEVYARLPSDLYAELESYKGKAYLWARYPAELIAANKAKGWPVHRQKDEFTPHRLYLWVIQIMGNYQRETGNTLRSHDFRRAAFTRAAEVGIHPKLAGAAFDVTAETMLRYYTVTEKKKTSDDVLGSLADKLMPKPTNGNVKRAD